MSIAKPLAFFLLSFTGKTPKHQGITVEAVPRQHPAAGVHGRPRPQPRPLPCYAWRSRQLLSRFEDPEVVRQHDVNEGARTHRVVSELQWRSRCSRRDCLGRGLSVRHHQREVREQSCGQCSDGQLMLGPVVLTLVRLADCSR